MAATDLAEYRGSEARRVQINFDLELGDQIERAGAIEMIALRRRLTDARTPSLGIVKYRHCHAQGPGTTESPSRAGRD
jgi:hypothetical protein